MPLQYYCTFCCQGVVLQETDNRNNKNSFSLIMECANLEF